MARVKKVHGVQVSKGIARARETPQDKPSSRETLFAALRLHGCASLGAMAYFYTMAHDQHDHLEPEQNEIGGPVVFALFLFAIVVVAIGMMAS